MWTTLYNTNVPLVEDHLFYKTIFLGFEGGLSKEGLL